MFMYFQNVFVQLFNDNKMCTYVELMSMIFVFGWFASQYFNTGL